jgi:hypothetical protein
MTKFALCEFVTFYYQDFYIFIPSEFRPNLIENNRKDIQFDLHTFRFGLSKNIRFNNQI